MNQRKSFNLSNLYDQRSTKVTRYVEFDINSNKNYRQLKKYINGLGKKLSLEDRNIGATTVDMLFGLKNEEINKKQIDFDFQSFKECVIAYKTKGALSPYVQPGNKIKDKLKLKANLEKERNGSNKRNLQTQIETLKTNEDVKEKDPPLSKRPKTTEGTRITNIQPTRPKTSQASQEIKEYINLLKPGPELKKKIVQI